MAEAFKTLKIQDIHPGIRHVTLDRPDRRNAINNLMMQELKQLWEGTHDHDMRCVIISGRPPAFCAGADLKERCDITLDVWRKQRTDLIEAMQAMIRCPVPIIAAVNGAAFGGGLELALASDFIYAAKNALFAQSEVKLGLMPGAMGTQNLPRALGIRRAKEISFKATSFTAEEAHRWGMVNAVYPEDELMNAVIDTAKAIAKNAPLAIRQMKKSMNAAQDLDLEKGFQFEVDAYNALLNSEDVKEGIEAFNQKREPLFKGK